MNGFFGILRLDGLAINSDLLSRCIFQSPHWQADHQACLIKDNLGLTCSQRFISSDAAHGLMPYEHLPSNCIIIADCYLTYREELTQKLGVSNQLADCQLILLAYLKWGQNCTHHLTGDFAFAIWNPLLKELFLAVDHFNTRTCFYTYQPGKYFIFANTVAPFRITCSKLTFNTEMMAYFALDSIPSETTCYQEINKILPAHQLLVTYQSLSKKCYWQLQTNFAYLSYKKRTDYYHAFKEIFTTSVKQFLRSDYPIAAQISGGLDSSSVASMAAKLLTKTNKPLYGFTAIPHSLNETSYRANWHYNELSRVETILKMFPNISHFAYQTNPTLDIFATLSTYYPLIDQPYRNIKNFEWIVASLNYALQNNCRIMLTGQHGNSTLSWSGQSVWGLMKACYFGTKLWRTPENLYAYYFLHHQKNFLKSPHAKKILRNQGININKHYRMLSKKLTAARISSIRPLLLWHGVESMDPTSDVKLVEFCHSIPQWVFYQGNQLLQKRLLVREGLAGLVPEAIRLNPYRGEQVPDWYLQYNHYYSKWRNDILAISDSEVGNLLYKFYDKESILNLFEKYASITQPSKEIVYQINCNLFRFLSLGFYCNYLQQSI
ncbi:MAG: hypothetical protein A3E87_10880 [Gammaproteobacteria bacterium RIFCSPHIGHO2_12_FULL_35_23]|nr:MAG: hypothetical protein A3E87_10880 [Gammaproteobacteria bacterium RIFCSPHIGHO2_12_FULL_35_23]